MSSPSHPSHPQLVLLSASCLLSLSLAKPEPEAEARAYTGGLISLDSPYILPLLLAGAAFAKVWKINHQPVCTISGQIDSFVTSFYGTE